MDDVGFGNGTLCREADGVACGLQNRKQDGFKQEVSMAKHHVANTLWRVVDRAMQVHGALGYSTDTPLAGMMQQARWARLADGADEVHQMRIAELLMRAYNEDGSIGQAVGGLPL